MANNVILRTISIVVLLPLILWVLYMGGIYFQAFALLCLYLMLREWFSMNKKETLLLTIIYALVFMAWLSSKIILGDNQFEQWFFINTHSELEIASISLISYGICIINKWKKLKIVLYYVSFIFTMLLLVLTVLNKSIETFSSGIAFIIPTLIAWIWEKTQSKNVMFTTGIIYLTLPMLFWLRESLQSGGMIKGHIILALAIVWSCDIFAYIGGFLIGGKKLAPSISPKKTWSGAIVGSIVAFCVSWITIQMMGHHFNAIFGLGTIIMIIAAILGDLLESKAKRILGVKDSGTIIPGHGGVCDRLDSFLAVTYVFIAGEILSGVLAFIKLLCSQV